MRAKQPFPALFTIRHEHANIERKFLGEHCAFMVGHLTELPQLF